MIFIRTAAALAASLAIAMAAPSGAAAQHAHHQAGGEDAPARDTAASKPSPEEPNMVHEMWMHPLGSGWSVSGMAQAIPTLTGGDLFGATNEPRVWEPYLTQPAAMIDLIGPGARLALRVTLNFEGITQRDGELTYGAWGEGFIDSRHPHTLLHELMLSVNAWRTPAGSFSISAGKGFAPYGTDDPMSRPVVKYPTNHHLSQILERWTLNAQYLSRTGTSVEAGLFGGEEPTGPYDFSNIGSFGDSWSVRLAQRFGEGFGPSAPWEISASYARVRQASHDAAETTALANLALRYDEAREHGRVYALAEASRSWPEAGNGYYALLGETRLGLGARMRHHPYYRVEYSTRPEYQREGVAGTDGFFRYDHDAQPIGATRWLINTVGYGYEASGLPVSARPFVELQHNRVWPERGGIDPRAIFGARSFWTVSAGVRLFFGGGSMRMGSYGLLDPMSAAMRPGVPMAGDTMQHGDMSHEGH